MNFKVIFAMLLSVPLVLGLSACSKPEQAPASETTPPDTSVTVTPEKQAAIDAIDKPVLDEKNTDISAEKANAPTDLATPASDVDVSKAQ